ncbi:PTS transporter subunit IIC [Agrococcus jejuensis]|uniref:PTS transporter subunit IIC n=1 Tax=Agrococcus jejuensis TaxID=399736 RepID=UPI0011A3B8D3|nr:PTS transporter subunit IIC [Agrococcus jejuensis]
MGVFEDIVRTITDNLFSQVAILIGLIALVGLALQRKPIEEVVAGAMRATIGVVILNIGIDLFIGGLVAFQAIVSSAMGLQPPAAESTLAEFNAGPGSVVPLIIAGGFVVHLVVVRIFPAARFVYLTGHLMYWMAVVLAATIVEAFGEVDRWVVAGAGAVIIGCYWVLQPLWTQPLMRKVMGDDTVGLAHTTSTLALAAGYGARALRLGDPVRHDSERLRLPKALSFFKDITVSTAFVTGIIMLVAIAFADAAIVEEQMAGSAVLPWVWGLLQALRFAAGIAILLFGVRMFLAEIVPAFRGLSEKVLPGTKPALDIPVTFTKAPTSVMVGFITSTVVFLILMGVFALAGWFVLVPPMIMLFFGGGAGGVFGNAVAGWRGAVFGGLLNGVVLAFGQWIGWGLYGSTAPELATLADPDWYAVGWILLGLGSLLAPLGAGGVWIIAGVVVAITVAVLVVLGRRGGGRDVLESVDEPQPVLVGAGDEGTATAMGRSPGADAARPAELRVLAVCGAGMGSSLILRTTAEAALADLGVAARLDHTDVSSARSATADVVVAQATYLGELGDLAPVMVPIESFVDRKHVEQRIADALRKQGWL